MKLLFLLGFLIIIAGKLDEVLHLAEYRAKVPSEAGKLAAGTRKPIGGLDESDAGNRDVDLRSYRVVNNLLQAQLMPNSHNWQSRTVMESSASFEIQLPILFLRPGGSNEGSGQSVDLILGHFCDVGQTGEHASCRNTLFITIGLNKLQVGIAFRRGGGSETSHRHPSCIYSQNY